MNKLTIKIKLKEYLRLLLHITYSKPIMIALVGFDLLMIGWIVLSLFEVSGIPAVTVYQYATVALISFVQPAVVISSIKKSYESSAHLKERTELEFTNEFLKITGESFYTELKWKKTYKIEELKEWFLIYHNNFTAVLIPKKKFTVQHAEEFRNFLRSIPGLRLKLDEKQVTGGQLAGI